MSRLFINHMNSTGGALSQAFGWRATFVLLAAMLIPILMVAIAFIPESHHYFVLKRVTKQNTAYGYVPGTAVEGSVDGGSGGDDNDEEKGEREPSTVLVEMTVASSDVRAIDGGGSTECGDIESNTIELVTPVVAVESTSLKNISTIENNKAGNNITAATGINSSIKQIIHIANAHKITRPPLLMPWVALTFMFEPQLAPSYCLICTSFAA